MNRKLAIDVDQEGLGKFCRRWKVTSLEVFGSAVTGSMRPDSDVDLLVTFAPDVEWSLLDHAAMEGELAQLFGRRVDLMTRRQVERSHNWLRRKSILDSAVPLDVPR